MTATNPPPPTPEPEPEVVTPPPAPDVVVVEEPPPGAPRRSPSFATMGKLLNPSTAEGKRIYVARDGSCYIQLPFPEGSHPVPGMSPPTQKLDCPPEIAGDAAWTECSGGAIHLPKEPDPEGQCVCFITGNPPPPPRWIPCPTHKG